MDLAFGKKNLGKIFVSYTHADKPFVRRLVERMEAEGYQTWQDEKDMLLGDNLVTGVGRAISAARVVVVVVSRRSVESTWLAYELNSATNRMIKGLCRVIPVVIDDCPLPAEVDGLLYADFRESATSGWERLFSTLEHEASRYPALPDGDYWKPILLASPAVVVGVHTALQAYEDTGMIGVGQAQAVRELLTYFDSFGLPRFDVLYASRVSDELLGRNLILVGGPDGNGVTKRAFSSMDSGILPAGISYYDTASSTLFGPSRRNGKVVSDAGIIIRAPSPFGSQAEMLIIAGSWGYGTWGGVRLLQSSEFIQRTAGMPAFESIFRVGVENDAPKECEVMFVRPLSGRPNDSHRRDERK